jgi:phosphatidyl-myo-inositol dimannoside synthase
MPTSLTEKSVFAAPEGCGKIPRRCGSGALLATDFLPVLGGISNYLFNVYRQFDLRKLTLIAPEHPDAERFDSAQAYAARRFPTALNVPGVRGAWQVWRMYREAESLVKRNRNLVLHCGHVNAAVAARKLKRRYGTPYLLWTHALEIMDEWLRGSILPAMLDADLVVTNSEFTRAFLTTAGLPQSRIVKIRPGADPAHFRPGLDCRDLARRLGVLGRPTLLTVSRIVKANRYKGHDVVLRAMTRVTAEIPNVAYVIVGEGDDVGYLEQLAHECGVRENVIFAGRVSDEELPLLYNACDAFILCSREERGRRGVLAEGFGIALLEASACGKPVIAGRSGGVPDAVLDGVTGLLVDPVDSDAVAATIVKVLTNRELAKRLGTNGRHWVEAEMNWTRAAGEFARAMQRFFPQVVGEGAVSSAMLSAAREAV